MSTLEEFPIVLSFGLEREQRLSLGLTLLEVV